MDSLTLLISTANDAQDGTSGGGLSDQVVANALRYRTNAPVVDALLGEVGLKSGGDMSQLLAGALTTSFVTQEAAAEPTAN